MITKLFFYLPVRHNLFLKTPSNFRSNFSIFAESDVSNSPFLKSQSHFRSNFSILAETNVSNSNAPSENLFMHFVTTRFNISTDDAAKMLKFEPSLGRLKTLDKVEEFVSMLNRHGCTEDQIAIIIRSQPSIITSILMGRPRTFASKLENFRSNLELLKTVFPTQDILNKAIMRRPHLFRKSLQKSLKPSVIFWEDFGFRGIELNKFLSLDPWSLTRCTLTPEQLDLISKIGGHKESKMHKYVVSVVANNRIEMLKAKIDNLQLCGLSPEEAWELVRIRPSVLYLSVEMVKKKMDFMLNHMELSLNFVTKHPRMFSMSLDKVMMPRF